VTRSSGGERFVKHLHALPTLLWITAVGFAIGALIALS
jgi:hypothetical protein